METPRTRPINKPFKFRGIRLMARPIKSGFSCCNGCFFNNQLQECNSAEVYAEIGSCCGPNREDHKNVIFVEVREKAWLK